MQSVRLWGQLQLQRWRNQLNRTSSKLPTIIAVNDRLNEIMVEELDGSYNRYKKVLTMWSHFCIIEKCEMEVESGSPCNWCGLTENQQYD